MSGEVKFYEGDRVFDSLNKRDGIVQKVKRRKAGDELEVEWFAGMSTYSTVFEFEVTKLD